MDNNKVQYLIGIDQGTTNIKAGLFDTNGELYAESSFAFTVTRDKGNRVEQDPKEWEAALDKVLMDLIVAKPDITITALCFCSQVNSHIFVDAEGKPLTKVILWQDQRANDYVDGLNKLVANNADKFPKGYDVETTSLLARAEWARVEEPKMWERTGFILAPKDYMNMYLTGIAATDSLSSIGLVDDDGDYFKSLNCLVSGVDDKIPPIVPFRSVIGTIKKKGIKEWDNAFADTKVVEGTMDAFGNRYGSGAVGAGYAIEVTGTCEIIGVVSKDNNPTPGVVTFPQVDGLWFHAGPTKSGGASAQWFAGVADITVPKMVEKAKLSPPGSKGLVFLPYLEGERAPIWDATARGVFFGICAHHKLEDFCRAVLEGVAFSARHLAEEIDKAAGFRAESLRISGGSSVSDLCCQIRADILNRNIERIHVKDSGMLGAALLAAVASKAIDNMDEAASNLVHIERTFVPQDDMVAQYDGLYKIYRNIYDLLKPAYIQLNEYNKTFNN